jgi:hypothetical protein
LWTLRNAFGEDWQKDPEAMELLQEERKTSTGNQRLALNDLLS